MDEDNTEGDPSPELVSFLDQPATRLELVQLVQPLRGVVIPLFQAALNSLVVVIESSADGEQKEKAKKAFEELDKIFLEIDKFDERLDNLLEGKPTWAPRAEETDND